LKENYPISLDPNSTKEFKIDSGTYSRDYSSFFLAHYKLRIDSDAIEGNTPIEVEYSTNALVFLKEFNLKIEDTRADFEVYVKDYNYDTKEITFEILNIEDVDIEALTIEIPKQENIKIKGANKMIVGDLDSNEYTTADFEAIPQNGKIDLTIFYTDSINVRRSLTKKVVFDSSYFENTDEKNSHWVWITLGLIIIVWISWKIIKKNKAKKKRLKERH
jgi:hypothetical protein